jgi:nucleoside-diphosphate-sugar epimerase
VRKLIIGCGYLGRRVARLWLKEGARVSATTRRPEHAADLAEEGIEPIVCDVLSPSVLRCLPAFDAVLYAVGLDRSSRTTMQQVYVDGLGRVLDHLLPPSRFIYVSSTSVYGQSDGAWVDEEGPTEPGEASGRIVLEAESVLRRALPAAVILRFAGIYGPGRLLRQKTIEAGEPIVGDGEKWLNLIHVDDGARAVLAAEAQAAPGFVCNVCDGQPVTRRCFFGELARLLGAPPPRFVAPPPGAEPPHERGHRRIDNRRLREGLGFPVQYADCRAGLAASLNLNSA